MQTIDTIRRTSELSKVLKQNGLAEDSFGAVGHANEAISDTTSSILEPENMDSGGGRLLQKISNLERSKHLLNGRVDQLQEELSAQNAAFKQLVARLDGAESKLRHLRMQPAAAEVSQVAPQEVPVVSAEPAQVPTASFQTTSAPVAPPPAQQAAPAVQQRHPRQAAMDEKFSIENVFYCGVK